MGAIEGRGLIKVLPGMLVVVMPFHSVLSPFQASPENECMGMEYLVQAAEGGHREAMIEVAKAYDTGERLGRAPEGNTDFPAKQR